MLEPVWVNPARRPHREGWREEKMTIPCQDLPGRGMVFPKLDLSFYPWDATTACGVWSRKTRKWRLKPLKSLNTDSLIAGCLRGAEGSISEASCHSSFEALRSFQPMYSPSRASCRRTPTPPPPSSLGRKTTPAASSAARLLSDA